MQLEMLRRPTACLGQTKLGLNCPCGFRPGVSEDTIDGEKLRGKGPSAATFSRARYKVDILHIYCRRRWWELETFETQWVSLCCLARRMSFMRREREPEPEP